MNIVLDNIVYALQNAGGISTYWYELSKRFMRQDEVDTYFVEFGTEKNNIQRKLLDIGEGHILRADKGGLFLQRFKRIDTGRVQSDGIFHSSYFRVPRKASGIKSICTVHDFTHDYFFPGPRAWLHNFAKRRAVLESDAIIAVSDNTRKDILKFYPGISPEKIHVIYNGVAEEFKRLNRGREHSGAPFFLFVGSRDKYKNFDFSVDLAAACTGFELKVVGKDLTKEETAMLNKKLPGRYSLRKNISIEALNELYNTAYCLLYPSSYEGFGIPLAEAMRAGCPFIALNASSIPEVAGDAGILLNKLDLTDGIKAVDRIKQDRAGLMEKGLVQSNKFSWDKCFGETYQLYKNTMG